MLRPLKNSACCLFIVLFCFQQLAAQQHQSQNTFGGDVGINVGLVLSLGTHVNRFGGVVNAYYKVEQVQVNTEFRAYFNAKNLGPNKSSLASVVSVGAVYGYGKKDTLHNGFYHPVSHQTQHQNSIGYAYRFYLNTINTNQKTGLLAIEVSKFSLIAENDLFAESKKDRYRTGAFLLQYQKNNYQLALNTTLFTGEMGERVFDESYPFNHLYENTKGGKYTDFSHGLLSAQVKYVDDFYQTYQVNVGIDAERVRHAIQNRLIHDFLVLPHLTNNINAHVPMLDDKGNQYLFKDNQKIKPMQLYINGFMNPSLFY